VSVKIDHLLSQFAVESRHYRNHENQDSDTEHDAQHGNQGDNGKKRALRLQVTKREKKAER